MLIKKEMCISIVKQWFLEYDGITVFHVIFSYSPNHCFSTIRIVGKNKNGNEIPKLETKVSQFNTFGFLFLKQIICGYFILIELRSKEFSIL